MIDNTLLEFANKIAASKVAHRDVSDPIFVEHLALACCTVAVASEAERAAVEAQQLSELEKEFAQ